MENNFALNSFLFCNCYLIKKHIIILEFIYGLRPYFFVLCKFWIQMTSDLQIILAWNGKYMKS